MNGIYNIYIYTFGHLKWDRFNIAYNLYIYIYMYIYIMKSVKEVSLFLKENTNNNLRYKIIYDNFKKNVEENKELMDSFTSCNGFGEVSFTWSWKILVDTLPDNFKFLEIGVYQGRVLSQVGMLAKKINKRCTIIGVTPLSTDGDKYSKYIDLNYLETIQRNFKKLNNTIANLKIIKGFSQNKDVIECVSKQEKYNMIFIDGSHDYEDVVHDILTYSKLLIIGGYLVLDDASLYLNDSYGQFLGHPDVSKACKDYLENNQNFEEMYAVGHNRVWIKIS